MIRLLICDDQAVVREGLAAMLRTVPTLNVVGLAQNGREAVEMVATVQPDVVLMDLKMPRLNGVKATKLIRQQYPAVAVLVLTTFATDEWVLDAIEAGAAGYLLKDTSRAALVAAIEGTASGHTYLDPQVAGTVMRQALRPKLETLAVAEFDLTKREQQILALIATGDSNREIGRKLHLSAGTIRNYISRIFDKIGVSDRTQAAVIATRLGLVV
ncbi:MAG: response regulator [Candidatus Promineifilaceae bacterium]